MHRIITKIIIHCSDSDVSGHDSAKVIKDWHLKRGFSDIGYHFVITKKGIEKGRPINIAGAHCKGENEDSIGICVTGRSGFSTKQMKMLSDLVHILKMIYPIVEVEPHNHYNSNKTCPNFKHELFGDY